MIWHKVYIKFSYLRAVLQGVPAMRMKNVIVFIDKMYRAKSEWLISSDHDGTECDGKGFPATIITVLLLMSPSNVFLKVTLKFNQRFTCVVALYSHWSQGYLTPACLLS